MLLLLTGLFHYDVQTGCAGTSYVRYPRGMCGGKENCF